MRRTSRTWAIAAGLVLTLLAAPGGGGQSGSARAQDPATVAIGGIVGKVLLDEADQKARDLLQQAKASGDYLLWQFATNMLNLIEKTRTEASGLLDETVDRIGAEKNKALYQVHELLVMADTNIQGAYLKADELTSNLAEIVNRMPIIGDNADLFAIHPAALPPVGTERIVRFLGPGMGAADAVATLPDGSKITLTEEKATSAYLKLTPLDFAAADGMPNFVEIKVDYVRSRAGWYCLSLFCDDEPSSKTIAFVVPPKVPGKVRLVHTVETAETIRDQYVVALNTVGKRINLAHPVKLPANFTDAGFEVDTAQVVAASQPGGNRLVISAWGHSGSCNGVDLATVRSDGFIYHVYAGATCSITGCDGGNQTCQIQVPLVKTVMNRTEAATDFQNLDWQTPTILTPDPAWKSVLIELERPDGSRVRFAPDERVLAVTVTTEPGTGAFRVLPFIGSASVQ